METPKFNRGIKLISDLVSEGKKVLVWGMFVGTMHKTKRVLESSGIRTVLVYGGTPKQNREGMNEFRDGEEQVLIPIQIHWANQFHCIRRFMMLFILSITSI